MSANMLSKPMRGRVPIAVAIVVALVGAGLGLRYLLVWRAWVSTDDAFIEARVAQVSPSIAGRVAGVHVSENQEVQAGQPMIDIDSRDADADLAQARAALRLAEAEIDAARATFEAARTTTAAAVDEAGAILESARARLTEAEAQQSAAASESTQAGSDLARYRHLSDRAISDQQREAAQSKARTAEARLEAARRNVAAARAAVAAAGGRLAAAEAAPHELAVREADVARAEAAAARARAAVDAATLEVSYTHIVAPEAGRITRKNVQPGNYVQKGQILMALLPAERWVVANFKETQLEGVRPGAIAELHVDAYPDATFRGRVESIQAGAGSRFSLLPPENATGNYVKVVQRVPVKIVFDEQPDPSRYLLGAGMSVVPAVKVR
ncbi:MAG: HlyD family secretion protein [Deltaproteobacteria bacterium]|nr:HlyD family secretion protein [Deltaproteobacteria bacterium]